MKNLRNLPHLRLLVFTLLEVIAAIALTCTLFFVNDAKTFTHTVNGIASHWSVGYTNYYDTPSFTNIATGWDQAARDAASSWGQNTPFSHSYNFTSRNQIFVVSNSAMQTPGAQAETLLHFNSSTPTLISYFEMHINYPQNAFYDGNYPYFPSNWYDLGSITRHEFGHGFGACHSFHSINELMYRIVPAGVTRPIDQDAINVARYIWRFHNTA